MDNEIKKQGGFHYAWVILVVATLILGVYVPVVNSLSNSWQLAVTNDLGFSRTAFSLMGTITQSIGIFMGPIISVFLTKYNFKRIWTCAAIVFFLGIYGYSMAQNQFHFYILSFFVGAAYITTAQIPMMMLINNWFQEQKGLATSIAVSGISAGGAILSPIISNIIRDYGWRTSYRIYAFIILALALVSGIFLIYLRPEDKGLKPYGYKEEDAENKEPSKDTIKSLNVGLSISMSLSCAFFILLLIGSVTNGIANGASLQFPPALQEACGFATASKIISLYLIIGVIGKLTIGKIADRFGIYHALFIASTIFSLTFICMLFINQSWGPWLLAFVFGFGLSMGTVFPPLITSSIFGRHMYGEAYSFVQSGMQIGAAIGPLLVSKIFDSMGAYTLAWILNFVFALMTAVFWFMALKSSKKYENKTEK